MAKAQPEQALWSINAYKTLAMVGGSLIVSVYLLRNNSRRSGKTLLGIGTIFLSLFFIISGFAHFKFDDFIHDNFMPSYLPFRPFWTYFCGIALIAGGIGIQIYPLRKTATLFTGLMIIGWFLLLRIPRFLANTKDSSDQMGLFESFAFAGIMFVLYGLLQIKKGHQALLFIFLMLLNGLKQK